MYHFDPLYIVIMLPVLIFSMIAQGMVKSNFQKYSKIGTRSGYTGKDIAGIILEKNGVHNIKIEPTSGWLSDHYSPADKILRLSEGVYNSQSISALGVAAHEAGHALQHYQGMFIMKLWMGLARPISLVSNAAIFLIIIGSFLSLFLAQIGLFFFLGVVVFQIITLPLEFNASNRAKKLLFEYNIVNREELNGVNAVLNSAALTYVAAAAAAVTQLLYFAIRLGLLGGRRD
ncbi:MAG: zinc metallopeptidase [Spirochaetes bacterium]|nr:zinc metallopeptidase [Spirochaetota bacterium]